MFTQQSARRVLDASAGHVLTSAYASGVRNIRTNYPFDHCDLIITGLIQINLRQKVIEKPIYTNLTDKDYLSELSLQSCPILYAP